MNTNVILSVCAAALLLSACAGRAPNPVAVAQAQDSAASCNAIRAEIAANDKRISELGSERGLKVAQNVVAGALGFFTLGIGWAAMDFQGAAGTDQEALEARNQYLGRLAAERCGGAVTLAK